MAQGQNSLAMPEISRSNQFSAEWRLRLTGLDSHDEQSQSKIVDIRTEIKAKYKLIDETLLLDLQPSLRLQSGQSQSVEGADKPENKISLKSSRLAFSARKKCSFFCRSFESKAYAHDFASGLHRLSCGSC